MAPKFWSRKSTTSTTKSSKNNFSDDDDDLMDDFHPAPYMSAPNAASSNGSFQSYNDNNAYGPVRNSSAMSNYDGVSGAPNGLGKVNHNQIRPHTATGYYRDSSSPSQSQFQAQSQGLRQGVDYNHISRQPSNNNNNNERGSTMTSTSGRSTPYHPGQDVAVPEISMSDISSMRDRQRYNTMNSASQDAANNFSQSNGPGTGKANTMSGGTSSLVSSMFSSDTAPIIPTILNPNASIKAAEQVNYRKKVSENRKLMQQRQMVRELGVEGANNPSGPVVSGSPMVGGASTTADPTSASGFDVGVYSAVQDSPRNNKNIQYNDNRAHTLTSGRVPPGGYSPMGGPGGAGMHSGNRNSPSNNVYRPNPIGMGGQSPAGSRAMSMTALGGGGSPMGFNRRSAGNGSTQNNNRTNSSGVYRPGSSQGQYISQARDQMPPNFNPNQDPNQDPNQGQNQNYNNNTNGQREVSSQNSARPGSIPTINPDSRENNTGRQAPALPSDMEIKLLKELQLVSAELADSVRREVILENKFIEKANSSLDTGSDANFNQLPEYIQQVAEPRANAQRLAELSQALQSERSLYFSYLISSVDPEEFNSLKARAKLQDELLEQTRSLEAKNYESVKLQVQLESLENDNAKLQKQIDSLKMDIISASNASFGGISAAELDKQLQELRIENKRLNQTIDELKESNNLAGNDSSLAGKDSEKIKEIQGQRDTIREALRAFHLRSDAEFAEWKERVHGLESRLEREHMINTQLQRKLRKISGNSSGSEHISLDLDNSNSKMN